MLRFVGLAMLPALGLYALWRYHVSVAGVDELKPLPLAQWNWIELPAIRGEHRRGDRGKTRLFQVHGGGAGDLAGAVVAARLDLDDAAPRLSRRVARALQRLSGAYLPRLVPERDERRGAFLLPLQHALSLVLSLCLALAARDLGVGRWLVGRRAQVAGRLALATTLLAPLGYAYRLRFDLDMPQPLVRSLAANVKPFLRDGDRLALLLPGDNSSVAAMIDQACLTETAPRRSGLDLLRRNTADAATLDEAARLGYRLALVSCVPEGWEDLPPNQAVLLRHEANGWRLLTAWAYPKQAFERRWQQILSWGPLCRRS